MAEVKPPRRGLSRWSRLQWVTGPALWTGLGVDCAVQHPRVWAIYAAIAVGVFMWVATRRPGPSHG